VANGAAAPRFADAFAERLAAELSGPEAAVGCKSILAYRHGFDIDPEEPGRRGAEAARSGSEAAAPPQRRCPTRCCCVTSSGWDCGLAYAAVPHGYGDADLDLHRSDPALLTGLIRRAAPLGTPIMLLHCYPYHRQAAYLAGVYPHVYFDIGLAVNYVGTGQQLAG